MPDHSLSMPNKYGSKPKAGRLWLILIAAIILVTWPVLPPNPFAFLNSSNQSVVTLKGFIKNAFHEKTAAHLSNVDDSAVRSDSSLKVSSQDIQSLSPHDDPLSYGLHESSIPSMRNKEDNFGEGEAATLARAQVLMQAKRVPEAIQEYQNVIKLDPQMALAHQQLGIALVLVNDLGQAVPEFETAARLDPKDANTHNDLGLAYLATDNRTAAKVEFASACLLDPKNIEAAINFANICSADGQYDRAIQVLKNSLTYNHGSAAGHNNLGTLLCLSGRLKDAVKEFEIALTLNPAMATAHYGLGVALLRLKSYPASIEELKMALSLNPTLFDAHNKLEQALYQNELSINSAITPD